MSTIYDTSLSEATARAWRNVGRRYGNGFVHHSTRSRLHRQGTRTRCWAADRCAPEAGDHAVRRDSDGGTGLHSIRVRATLRNQRNLHSVSKDRQRRRLFRLYRRDEGSKEVGARGRSARLSARGRQLGEVETRPRRSRPESRAASTVLRFSPITGSPLSTVCS